MNFLEKRLEKEMAEHLEKEFGACRPVKIPNVGTASYHDDGDFIVVHCTDEFIARVRELRGKT